MALAVVVGALLEEAGSEDLLAVAIGGVILGVLPLILGVLAFLAGIRRLNRASSKS